ncbi:putative quinol monooxygenase [Gluconacetobacter entanii]|uniref:Antibiotic biosynthesis monooxygenase n=1 Tax=Gluconacetobacter entanii TaxID=108528 RepID=A0A318PV97_9PROT|nr:putative quinol monooxygenase [Gluconacetobacter entanii]MCE2579718.1 antibiotic biosynthesis monooxygenase [Komagataeibacter sp. FNDCR1]PYD64571.1 antibiotic biosynthesis monooxygenase [Gluconacetobacter entanii]
MTDTRLIIIAEFETTAATRKPFLEACLEDSIRSVADEAGCSCFDVLTTSDEPDTVILHEVYDSPAAFEAHQATPHFKAFSDAVNTLKVRTVSVRKTTRNVAA